MPIAYSRTGFKTTFRVKGNNLYTSSSDRLTWYNHSQDVWKHYINWNGIIKQILGPQGVSGSQQEADLLADTMKKIAYEIDLMNSNNTNGSRLGISKEDLNILAGDLKGSTGSLFNLLTTKSGTSFEKYFSRLIDYTFSNTVDQMFYDQYQTGFYRTKNVYIGEVDIFKGSVKISDAAIRNTVKETVGMKKGLTNLAHQLTYKIQRGNANNPLIHVTVSMVGKQQLVDVDASDTANLNVQVAPGTLLYQFGNLVKGHTFSLKNYSKEFLTEGRGTDSKGNIIGKGWGIAGTSDIRAFYNFTHPSGFSYVNDNLTFLDTCTFLYSTTNNPDADDVRMLGWARAIYMLTGVGQSKLVDYIVLNVKNDPSLLQIISTKSYLESFNIPNDSPLKLSKFMQASAFNFNGKNFVDI